MALPNALSSAISLTLIDHRQEINVNLRILTFAHFLTVKGIRIAQAIAIIVEYNKATT